LGEYVFRRSCRTGCVVSFDRWSELEDGFQLEHGCGASYLGGGQTQPRGPCGGADSAEQQPPRAHPRGAWSSQRAGVACHARQQAHWVHPGRAWSARQVGKALSLRQPTLG
ncbi:unnamed protein product, partial [Ectocarpus fasciculatus]